MARYFPSELRWTTPQGGFCSWVTLPPGSSTIDLYLAGVDRGVAFAPGDVFFAGPAPQPYIRLAFSSLTPELIDEAIQVLGQVFSTHMARRAFTAPALSDCVPLV